MSKVVLVRGVFLLLLLSVLVLGTSSLVWSQDLSDSRLVLNTTVSVNESRIVLSSSGEGDSRLVIVWESYTPGPPTNFTATQVGPEIADLTWVKDPLAFLTIIRGSSAGYPESITDGYLVYSGNGTSVLVEDLSLSSERYYYRAWSWNSFGYSTEYAETTIGGNIVMSVGLVVLAIALTALFFWKRSLVFAMASSMSWLALGILLLVEPGFLGLPAITESWVQILAFIFFIMAIGCILWFVANIGKIKITQTDLGTGRTFETYGKPPTSKKLTRSQEVKKKRKSDLRRLSGR